MATTVCGHPPPPRVDGHPGRQTRGQTLMAVRDLMTETSSALTTTGDYLGLPV